MIIMDGVNTISIIENVTTNSGIIEKNDLYGSYFFILNKK
jgi:hypothetical protein